MNTALLTEKPQARRCLAHNAMLDMLPTSRCPASLLYNIVRGGVLAHNAMLDMFPTSRCPASLLYNIVRQRLS